MKFEVEYGKLIRARRLALGLRMRDMMALCGLTHPTLKKIETGRPVKIYALVRVLNALDIHELP